MPYVDVNWENTEMAALVIMDNFRGQVTPSVVSLLEDNNIQVCLLPANITDRLQPLDISVNKPAKQREILGLVCDKAASIPDFTDTSSTKCCC